MGVINRDKKKPLTFRYRFAFENGVNREFVVHLDPVTLQVQVQHAEPIPEWALLNSHKCPNCPLSEKTHKYCPIAINLVDIVDFFKEFVSYEKTYVTIESGSRTFMGKIPLQEGIKSLVGIYMVTSGCPIMDKFRPMARLHTPFPTMEESVYKLVSMYLLSQFFVAGQGKKPDWELKKLKDLCNEVIIVNRGFFKRIKGQKVKDASLNALVALDSFASYTLSYLEENNLEELRHLFEMYLSEPQEQHHHRHPRPAHESIVK